MKAFVIVVGLSVGLMAPARVVASPLHYTLTDLGTTYGLQKGGDGTITGVTDAAGTTTYAFDKTPVVVTVGPRVESADVSPIHYNWVTTFQTRGGTYSVGTQLDWINQQTVSGTQVGSGGGSGGPIYGTVNDVNIHGQMVGSTNGGSTLGVMGIAGADGMEGILSPYYDSPVPDPLADFHFFPGATIDDLGRILAYGSNHHAYLLTPNSLGPPQTVPEPTVLAVFLLGGGVIALQRLRKRTA